MVCNELYWGQGLGNQLWNYVVARVIAQRHNRPFSILGRDRFKGKKFMDLDFGVELTGGQSPEGGPPTRLPNGILHYYRERRENLAGTAIDISRTDEHLLEIPANTKFDGNCQSTKYLDNFRDSILSWVHIRKEHSPSPLGVHSCVIHLRGGDFATVKEVFLPKTYYRNAMDYMRTLDPNVQFYCVTDDPAMARTILPEAEVIGAAMLNQDDPEKAGHHLGGPVDIDFKLLVDARYLILSNSSFSWWAAYLNKKKEVVIAPKYWAAFNRSKGYWSTSDIITDGFMYLDRSGQPYSSEECWEEKSAFEKSNPKLFSAPTLRRGILQRTIGLFRI